MFYHCCKIIVMQDILQTDYCISDEYDKHHQDSFQEQATRGEVVSRCTMYYVIK